jgi:hypothetical protein
MMWRHGLRYVLRHAWLWPLVFWLRPFDVMARLKSHQLAWMEFAAAGVGGAVWGSMAGGLLWFWTGEVHAIWSLGFAGAAALAANLAYATASDAADATTGVGVGAGAGVIAAALGISIGI